MFVKIARAQIRAFGNRELLQQYPLRRYASQVPVAEYSPHYLYCISEAIHSWEYAGPNENFDAFEAEELRAYFPTFIMAGVYKDHENLHREAAVGICLDAWPIKGEPTPGVDVLMAVSRTRAPEECDMIASGELTETSMGVVVGRAICAVCDNVASEPEEFCVHIAEGMKGQEIEGQLCFEYNRDLNFFENTLISPWNKAADSGAYIKQRIAMRQDDRIERICRQLDRIYEEVARGR